MTLSRLKNLHTISVDFVKAYPQGPLKPTIYLHHLTGAILNQEKGDIFLKLLLGSLYRLMNVGLSWFDNLSQGLHSMGLDPTISNPYILSMGPT